MPPLAVSLLTHPLTVKKTTVTQMRFHGSSIGAVLSELASLKMTGAIRLDLNLSQGVIGDFVVSVEHKDGVSP